MRQSNKKRHESRRNEPLSQDNPFEDMSQVSGLYGNTRVGPFPTRCPGCRSLQVTPNGFCHNCDREAEIL